MAELEQIRAELHFLKNPQLAEIYKQNYKSPYDFYGLKIPMLRKIAKKYNYLQIYDAMNLFDELWNSGNHEEMSLAIFIMQNYKKHFNLEMWKFLTNEKVLNKLKTQDHVDALANILGNILLNNNYLTTDIKGFTIHRNSIIRRLSIMSLKPLIKKNKLELLKLLAERLAYDEDLGVQKATGQMLKEAAKKDSVGIRNFIFIHRHMKSTCLNYALKNMPEAKKAIKEKLKMDKKNEKNSSNI